MSTSSNSIYRRLILITVISFIIAVLLLASGRSIIKQVRKNRMIAASYASSRIIDGVPNEVLMYGNSGFVGNSRIYVHYLSDGYISISGYSRSENYQWKKISDFILKPGTYSFTGLSGVDPETVQLQLDYPEGDSFKWYFLWNEDIQFTIDETKEVELFIRVVPGVSVNTVARPAVYRDE